jgi:hypothetical protein
MLLVAWFSRDTAMLAAWWYHFAVAFSGRTPARVPDGTGR